MIKLKKYAPKDGEATTISVNIDIIIAVEPQPSAIIGQGFTVVIVQGGPPIRVKDSEDEIVDKIRWARSLRVHGKPQEDGKVRVI